MGSMPIIDCNDHFDCFGFEDFGHEQVWLDANVLGTFRVDVRTLD